MTALPALKLDPPRLRDDTADVTRGMTDAHRNVYRLLVTHPNGLTRDELAARSGLDDRKVRAIVEELRVVAALVPHPRMGPLVIGFDPQARGEGAYVYAQSVEQADRIMAPQESRIKSIAAAWRVQQKAAEHLGRRAPPAVQDALLTVENRSAWRGG